MERYVIIGAGAAGISAAQVLRDFKPQAVITVISIDQHVHSRCMLHKFLGGERDIPGISFTAFSGRQLRKDGSSGTTYHPDT